MQYSVTESMNKFMIDEDHLQGKRIEKNDIIPKPSADTKNKYFNKVSKRLSRISEVNSPFAAGGDLPSQWKTNILDDYSDFDSPMKSDRSTHQL